MKKLILAAFAAVALLSACEAQQGTITASQTCEAWSADYGLSRDATVIVCQTGENAKGDMTEAEYRAQMDRALTQVLEIIEETGGL